MLCGIGWFRTDVSGLRIGPIFKGRDVLLIGHPDPWKMEPIYSPETSMRNQPTPRNIPEDDRIQVKRSGSLRPSHTIILIYAFTATEFNGVFYGRQPRSECRSVLRPELAVCPRRRHCILT